MIRNPFFLFCFIFALGEKFLSALAVVFLRMYFSYLGRGGGYEDPMLDPLNNPNIR